MCLCQARSVGVWMGCADQDWVWHIRGCSDQRVDVLSAKLASVDHRVLAGFICIFCLFNSKEHFGP